MKKSNIAACATATVMILMLSFGSAGCGTKQAAPAPVGNGPRAQALDGTPHVNDGAPVNVAAHLESLARGVEGVRNANCVVFGNYAIVGIDVDEKMERTQVGTTKYAVAEALRKDPYGADALVTADIDMGQRLREIRADIMNGRPISGFAEELADIVGRLVPQIPRNIVPPKTPEDTGTTPQQQLEK